MVNCYYQEHYHDALKDIYDLIFQSPGMLQKELRKKTGYGEMKLSLMLTVLESQNKITKKKIGRDNHLYVVNIDNGQAIFEKRKINADEEED